MTTTLKLPVVKIMIAGVLGMTTMTTAHAYVCLCNTPLSHHRHVGAQVL